MLNGAALPGEGHGNLDTTHPWGARHGPHLGIAWSAAGAVLARMPGFDSDLPFPILFAMLGFVSGVLFTGLIAMIEKGRSYDRIPLARFAAWGGAGG
jgi:hypothetical protein